MTTDYAKQVKIELIKREKTQKWLEEQITQKTGLYCDSGLLSKIFSGKKARPRVVSAINEILEIEDDYRADDGKQAVTA